MKEIVCKLIFFIFGASFFLFSQIFLLFQGLKNFYEFKDKKMIVERTLFEQFSEEVYESINTPFSLFSLVDDCYDSDALQINLNMDTYFDCKNIHSSDLKSECQRNIVKNYTDCSPDSYRDINFDTDQDLLKYEYRINFDKRMIYCSYFSNLTQKLLKVDEKYICRNYLVRSSYENLLSNSFPLNDIYGVPNSCPEGKKKCGILDTKNNILCLDNYLPCPYNTIIEQDSKDEGQIVLFNRSFKANIDENKPIITSVIISENQPMNHEWKKYIKELYNDLDEDEIREKRSLTKNDFELLGKGDDNTYQKLNIQLTVKEISETCDIKAFDSSRYNMNQKLNIYTRNYIGFKDVEELNNFKTYFNEKDPMDNPLYKLSCSKYNPIMTMTFASFFLLLDILYIIFLCNALKREKNDLNFSLVKVFLAINIILLAVELFNIAFHFIKYPKIKIDMDNRMKAVLDLYNERTFSLQLYRIISVAFSVISIILTPIRGWKIGDENRGNLIQNQ